MHWATGCTSSESLSFDANSSILGRSANAAECGTLLNFQGSIAVTGTGSVAALALRQNTAAGIPSYTNLPVTSGVSRGPAGATRVGPTPTQINGITGVVTMWDGVPVTSDGTVWGLKVIGDSDRTRVVYVAPAPLDGLTGVVALSGNVVMKSDETVWELSGSQLKQVSGLSDVVMVHQSTGGGFLALKRDGTIWGPGPSEVNKPPGTVVAVAALAFADIALMGDGTVWLMSLFSGYFQLQVLNGIVAIDGAYFEALGLKSDGTVWELDYPTSRQVQGIPKSVSISSGDSHCMALAQDGTVWEWGVDFYSNMTTWPTPRQVSGLNEVVKIKASGRYSIALKSDGTVWMWTTE